MSCSRSVLVGMRVLGAPHPFGTGCKRRARFREDFPESVFIIRRAFNKRGEGIMLPSSQHCHESRLPRQHRKRHTASSHDKIPLPEGANVVPFFGFLLFGSHFWFLEICGFSQNEETSFFEKMVKSNWQWRKLTSVCRQ